MNYTLSLSLIFAWFVSLAGAYAYGYRAGWKKGWKDGLLEGGKATRNNKGDK
jgi:hypothetical protein